ncbi:MAG: SDR family oxidoreductase [Chloroflexi bacterium]|nr:SDR family oxidoreductase [Chloroflexota bacterium]MCH9040129.1 SDR family oxidoreductase [Chloroflexota bacterium]
MSEKELQGKVAIVTGAGRLRGIGRAASVALAKLGADVVVTGTGRSPDRYPDDEKAAGWHDVESTAEQVRAEGGRALPLVVDVSDPAEVQSMVDRTLEELGRIDILVNNAAYAMEPALGPLIEVSPEMFQRVQDVKVKGTFLCSQSAARTMIDRGEGGKIINLSSAAGKRGTANTLAYNAACFALIGMTQSMARELGPHGINVNCVCPGTTATSRTDFYGRDEFWNQRAAGTALGRNGTDDEVGAFIAYLCTEASSWITGQSININGGTVMEH